MTMQSPSPSPQATEKPMEQHQRESTNLSTLENASDGSTAAIHWTAKEEKRILRKIDIRLIPYATLIYFLANLDRSNVSQAQVAGIEQNLGLKGNQYNIALTLFFVPYISFELITLIALRKLRPNLWIPTLVLSWGLVTTLMGLSQNFSGFVAARWFLGVAESGLYPSLQLLITSYYPLDLLNFRVGFFFSAASLAGAFGGLLASAILLMDGIAGQYGWQWLFYLEGILTFLCAIPGYWIIPNFSDQKSRGGFLTKDEKEIWNEKLLSEQTVLRKRCPFSWSQLTRVLMDWKTYCFGLLYLSIATVSFNYTLFLPAIVKGFGFTGVTVNLLSVPPNFFAFLVTLAVAIFSDRKQIKGPIIIGLMSLATIGQIIALCDVPLGVSYFAVFLVVASASACIAVTITWISNNCGPPYSKATAMGLMLTIGNSSGMISSNIFPDDEAPKYTLGNAVGLGFCITAVICAALLTFEFKRLNAKRDREDKEACEQLLCSLDDKSRAELGDRHPHFRYIL